MGGALKEERDLMLKAAKEDTKAMFGQAEQLFDKVQDSGERRQYQTGAQRDIQRGKGRFDLIPAYSLKRLAVHFENGAIKYGENNWQKGMPLQQYLNSAIRHLYAYLAGSRDEDHLAAVAWNVFVFQWTEQAIRDGRLPKELDDLKTTDRPLVEVLTKVAGNGPKE